MNLSSDLEIGLFFMFSIVAVISSLTIVSSKSLINAAFSLIFLGISTAVMIVDLDPAAFAVYSAVHLLLYVGATVTFLVISLVLFKSLDLSGAEVRWAVPLSFMVGSFILLSLMAGLSQATPQSPSPLSLLALSQTLVEEFWFPAVILIIALAATLIEAIALARRE